MNPSLTEDGHRQYSGFCVYTQKSCGLCIPSLFLLTHRVQGCCDESRHQSGGRCLYCQCYLPTRVSLVDNEGSGSIEPFINIRLKGFNPFFWVQRNKQSILLSSCWQLTLKTKTFPARNSALLDKRSPSNCCSTKDAKSDWDAAIPAFIM